MMDLSQWAGETFPALQYSAAFVSLHSPGISSAVTNKINLGVLLRIWTAYIYVYVLEKSTIVTWLKSLETARSVPAQPGEGFSPRSSSRKSGTPGREGKIAYLCRECDMFFLFSSFCEPNHPNTSICMAGLSQEQQN